MFSARSTLLLAACTLSCLPATALHAAALRPAARPAVSLRTIRRVPAPMFVATSIEGDDEQPKGLGARLSAAMPPKSELQKMIPLTMMFFSILFSYTILRDTKDVLVVTAPGSSAEAIPFLKTWVNLPGAIAFTILYSSMSNVLGREALFYSVLGPFVGFFASFAWIIYPLRDVLHPTAFAAKLALLLPISFAAPIAVFRNWTYSLFYLLANMWGSVVVSLLFWGFANEVTTVDEAKKYYPLFGMGANVALIFSGQFVRYVSGLHTSLPAGADPWGVALKYLMSAVVASGAVIAACFRYINVAVLKPLEEAGGKLEKKAKKKKPNMGLGESFTYLAKSPYIRNLATLVIAYGMSINLVEVTWKSKLKLAYPDPNAYSAFMGQFSSTTGVVTLLMMFFGRFVFRKYGWGTAATITPAVLLATGAAFFSLILFGDFFSPAVALFGTTPLMLAVLVGAAQNIMSKAAKYSLFDPCKEMAYIPLDQEQKTKGKAAIDVIGGPLGKSGGSLIQQILIVTCGSLAAATPYLAIILAAIIGAWLLAARNLSTQFEEKMAQEESQ